MDLKKPGESSTRPQSSSAAFLHHLHTDPSSHHVTLSASTSRHASAAASSSFTPLEPTASDQSRPSMRTRGSGGGGSFRRPRPKTAPGRAGLEVGGGGGGSGGGGDHTPTSPGSGSSQHPSPEPAVGSQPEPEACFYNDEISQAMDAISLGGKPILLGKAGSLAPQAQAAPAPQSTADQISWNQFARNYAAGNFDPNKIPQPPVSTISSPPIQVSSAHSSPGTRYRSLSPTIPAIPLGDSSSDSQTSSSRSILTDTSASSAPSTSAGSTSGKTGLPRSKAMELENLPARLHRPDKLVLPSYNLAAATVRMVSSGYSGSDFAPLGVPSPDKELMDPLASAVSHASDAAKSASSDPGRGHLSRSMSSTMEPDRLHAVQLPTIEASPVSTPFEAPKPSRRQTSPQRSKGGVNPRIPPATAPLMKTLEAETETDYFGVLSPPGFNRQISEVSTDSSAQTVTQSPQRAQDDIVVVPPVPPAGFAEFGEFFEKHGFLPAPIPANDEARRRSLYRFNILHTSPDVNFDRIAHMTKLVFNTRMVAISLIDGDSQWHKSETGLGVDNAKRLNSFCAHSILSKSDEPFIVLNALEDWRFCNNPNVAGPPNIRFYAGAPLRTADGYNIGSLCIIDDKPRTEFPPRLRLILKEFAAVTMREMELWRDKLQLRIRDKIQTTMERFTRECLEMDAKSTASNAQAAAKMDQVYARASSLVCSTLDMDGAHVLDTTALEPVEHEGRVIFRAEPYTDHSPILERSEAFGPLNAFPILGTTNPPPPSRTYTSAEHQAISEFLRDNRDGKIFEHKAPSWLRHMIPKDFRFAMVVPVFGVDQNPFALLCTYTSNKTKQYLEGYELQFLRAIGVIILSAVLRRRMVLADKAKSILISSVSHELRTPLHGILAAAELLSDTQLDANQVSFLKTVQSCGNSLIETVNHVLDFTKLSGGSSGSGGSIKLARVNLATLVEQTVEGSWVGQRARFFLGDSDIGSYYAPTGPTTMVAKNQRGEIGEKLAHVETVIDIGQREKGWNVRCEKGGLRRVLMNLVGNSLKFTKDGYIQVTLRELPHEPGAKMIPVEMAVIDTGKGIGKEFLKEQLFHPFSQENPLQTGTGLGLAIVNSIVRSESVNGKVDVWSSEGMGTEIRVSFEVEVLDDDDDTSTSSNVSTVSSSSSFGQGTAVRLIGFDIAHRGQVLSLDVLCSYAASWNFEIADEADILVVNEDISLIDDNDVQGAVILLTSSRSSEISALAERVNSSGGSFQLLYKPIGPTGLKRVLHTALQWLEYDSRNLERPPISRGSSGASQESNSTISELSNAFRSDRSDRLPLTRRRSEETDHKTYTRPSMAPRGVTYHHAPAPSIDDPSGMANSPSTSSPSSTVSSTVSTISLADGGVMLKAAAQPAGNPPKSRAARVMVVEDNVINRRVLGAFLKKRGCEFEEAWDGQAGVDLFASKPPNYWDVILMDISMPVMDGHEATRAIRKIEGSARASAGASTTSTVGSPTTPTPLPSTSNPSQSVTPPPNHFIPAALASPIRSIQYRAKIFALTGLATADDKRKAFHSGVDGYLVKPVSLASLDVVFKKLGF